MALLQVLQLAPPAPQEKSLMSAANLRAQAASQALTWVRLARQPASDAILQVTQMLKEAQCVQLVQELSPPSILACHQQKGVCAQTGLTAIWVVNVLPAPQV